MFNYLNQNVMKSIIFLGALLMGLSFSTLSAQSLEPQERKTKFSIEIDPATFAFGGYSAHLRIQPKSSDHLLLGMGIYAMDLPSVFVDINSKNAGRGWKTRINRGIGAFGEYFFGEVNKKFFVGSQVSTQEFLIEKQGVEGSQKFNNALLMGYGGYSIQPFSFPLYFKAWGGLGYTTKLTGENVLEGETYHIAPLSVFATLHIGYTF
jgi:hypothetical protein